MEKYTISAYTGRNLAAYTALLLINIKYEKSIYLFSLFGFFMA
jgi:hypothetical protein